MLQMRPVCECCAAELPAHESGAWICSFECTFCEACAGGKLGLRCPNCGGQLLPRPARSLDLLQRYPASQERIVKADGCSANA